MEKNANVHNNQINKTQEQDEKGPQILRGIFSSLKAVFGKETTELSQEDEILGCSEISKEDARALLDSIKKADKIVKPTDSGIVIKRPLKDDKSRLQEHARIATKEAFDKQHLQENTTNIKNKDDNEKIIGE